MKYRLDKQGLLGELSVWDGYLKRKIHLIACGGTAMTLLDVKESTKDIDLLVPNEAEYDYLIRMLKQLGYKSLIRGKKKEIDLKLLVERFRETASFDISEKRINKNLDYFLNRLRKEA